MLHHSFDTETHGMTAVQSSVITDSGFSSARRARMHAALRRHVDSGQVPGLVALVHQRGREHVETIGTMAFDSNAPMRRDTIFRLASMTKPITAVGAMILVEECKLRLDDPVDDMAAGAEGPPGPADDREPARRHGAREAPDHAARPPHVSLGLRRGGASSRRRVRSRRRWSEARLPLSAWPFAGTPDEFMKRLGSLPLAHQPGERWLYHMSAEILGVLIARVSGMSLATFLHERIFEPLGMKDTGFQRPGGEARPARRPATGRISSPASSPSWTRRAAATLARPPVFESGAGGSSRRSTICSPSVG